ncbi:GlxA family transcriptional regulator [Planosporangium sp. 12N6]|uniref:GlxA family transcriptional regulator n=1 Tax=Planosporangium spinosum TaxID=3402278 RepID=UPI003CFADD64
MRKNRAMATRHRVAVLALDQVVAFDLGVPSQVFGAARTSSGERLYTVVTCTPDGGPVSSTGGFAVVPEADLSATETADTVVVPGIRGGPPLTDGTVDAKVAAALVAARDRGARVMSICTAASVLAAAGLLDDRPATTHWYYADLFRRLYPRVRLDPSVLFVDDGEVLTSAGVAAGVDLCLHVVRRDHGSEVANRSARRCVVPPWRDGGQAQYIEHPLPRDTEATTAPARGWALAHLGDPLTLAVLAERTNMSVRTFTRRFRAETGMSPTRWLLQQRIDRARSLLETTDLSVERIARQAGLGTATSLRQHLRATIGVSPTAYRRTFTRDGASR